ncbi:DUF3634 family protein [Shewanella baltica]|uniref:DUF3634 domain-containing protein n=1 Tax=Shewanella baltica (strain OS195) TaxID=399599 RepID=A9KXR1_SHEB9|nr:DUF3634 family protein [Shewanella baltica]ABS09189.1 conserved hypothetical protein [Shewanella baltica OS185]ABX50363.1 conserved hypothetical protein [Shewanella baltica OS195]ADT95349.1 hypothetical protein Sbal678_3207 [Shewanella baltica OS678]EHC06485.1 hypothetical protein Sbal625DRAFT_2163 [Shewanella baltica OS625]
MTADIFKLFFVAIGIFLVYKLIFGGKKGLTIFEMHFKDGRMTQHKGKIPERFERECRHIAKVEKLTCTVRAEKSGDVRLHISANVSDNVKQRIRNLFPFEYYDKKSIDNSRQAG